MKHLSTTILQLSLLLLALFACNNDSHGPSKEAINQLALKSGELISCGTANNEFGSVNFDMSCDAKVKKDFNLAMELLHSFEYGEAEKVFAKVIAASPECAMAYWGIAMSNFHPLWSPPTEAELIKGEKALVIANSITTKSTRETGYVKAIAAFYTNWKTTDHLTRCINFEKAMEQLYASYPEDKEAAIFYALALDASASPTDKDYINQKKAGAILDRLYTAEPNHPGIIHYIIHTYDYPGLAELALPAAKRYATVAPSSAHALHMPSHIFTRLGLWDECIQSNVESVTASQCYAKSAGMKGHWDEELHGMDYLVYAYLQKGENSLAQAQLNYLDSMKKVEPVNFKVAYAFAAIPSRIVLENKKWSSAAALQIHTADFSWKKFPWQEAIIHFTRLMGAVHTEDMNAARNELAILQQLHDTLKAQKDAYQAAQVAVQVKSGEAWLLFKSGDVANAVSTMQLAADMEDSSGKHPVTPGEVIPARELLGDMLLEMKQNDKALIAYEEALKKSPNRFNSLYGAGLASERAGNMQKAVSYYQQLVAIAGKDNISRPELVMIKSLLVKVP